MVQHKSTQYNLGYVKDPSLSLGVSEIKVFQIIRHNKFKDKIKDWRLDITWVDLFSFTPAYMTLVNREWYSFYYLYDAEVIVQTHTCTHYHTRQSYMFMQVKCYSLKRYHNGNETN